MRVTEVRPAGESKLRAAVGGQITIVVPIVVMQRSARKQIIGPISHSGPEARTIKLTPFQLALVRGHHWLAMLESGGAASLKDIAEGERADPSHVSRLINFTTLAPQLVAAILDDRVPPDLTVLGMAIDPQPTWSEQVKPPSTPQF